jgi:hypothetical protein
MAERTPLSAQEVRALALSGAPGLAATREAAAQSGLEEALDALFALHQDPGASPLDAREPPASAAAGAEWMRAVWREASARGVSWAGALNERLDDRSSGWSQDARFGGGGELAPASLSRHAVALAFGEAAPDEALAAFGALASLNETTRELAWLGASIAGVDPRFGSPERAAERFAALARVDAHAIQDASQRLAPSLTRPSRPAGWAENGARFVTRLMELEAPESPFLMADLASRAAMLWGALATSWAGVAGQGALAIRLWRRSCDEHENFLRLCAGFGETQKKKEREQRETRALVRCVRAGTVSAPLVEKILADWRCDGKSLDPKTLLSFADRQSAILGAAPDEESVRWLMGLAGIKSLAGAVNESGESLFFSVKPDGRERPWTTFAALRAAGADPNSPASNGERPFHALARRHHGYRLADGYFQALHDCGGDAGALDAQGRSAADVARESAREERADHPKSISERNIALLERLALSRAAEPAAGSTPEKERPPRPASRL